MVVENRKTPITLRNRRHILYFEKKIDSSVFVFKVAKERLYTKHEEGVDDIQLVRDREFPFFSMIVDLEKQVILCQWRSTTVKDRRALGRILESILKQATDFGDYALRIEPVSATDRFWSFVNSADRLYSIHITLHSPNFFEGLFRANELVARLQSIYCNTEVSFEVKNDEGQLRAPRDLEDIVNYVGAGGGAYRVTAKMPGSDAFTTLRSSDVAKSVMMPENPEELDADEIRKHIDEVGNTNEQ